MEENYEPIESENDTYPISLYLILAVDVIAIVVLGLLIYKILVD